MEHHSNIVPWQLLARTARPSSPTCRCSTTASSTWTRSTSCSRAGPSWSRVAHVSNVLGTINPVAEIARRAHEAGAVVLVDGAQAVPQLPVDLRAIDADFYALDRPQGLRPDGHRRAARPPRAARGDAAVHRRRAHDPHGRGNIESTWTDLPWKFEAGTSPIAEAIGLGAAVDWLRALGHGARPRARAGASPPTRSSGSPRSRA